MWENSSWTKLEKSRGKAMDRSNSFVGSRARSSSLSTATGKPNAIGDRAALLLLFVNNDVLLFGGFVTAVVFTYISSLISYSIILLCKFWMHYIYNALYT